MKTSPLSTTADFPDASGDTIGLFSPAAHAVRRYWQAGNVCPSDEPGLGGCVTDDALFFQFLIAELEARQARAAPQWCMESPTVNQDEKEL